MEPQQTLAILTQRFGVQYNRFSGFSSGPNFVEMRTRRIARLDSLQRVGCGQLRRRNAADLHKESIEGESGLGPRWELLNPQKWLRMHWDPPNIGSDVPVITHRYPAIDGLEHRKPSLRWDVAVNDGPQAQ